MSHAAPAAVTLTGDDLDDNFVLDDEFAGSASDLETEQVGASEAAILSDDAGAAYESSDEATPGGGTAKKRAAASESGDEHPAAAAPTSKRAAKKANQRKKAKVADLGLEDKTHDDMGLLPVEALADRLAEKQRAALPNLSALELDEQRISREFHTAPTCGALDCPLTNLFSRRIDDPRHFVSDGTGFFARFHETGYALTGPAQSRLR